MANIAASRMHPFHPKQLSDIEMQVVTCDLLIIGGGNAGCFVATEAAKLDPSLKVVIMEKAEIMRSGALFRRHGRHQHVHPQREDA